MLQSFLASLVFFLTPYLWGRFFKKSIFLSWVVGAFFFVVSYLGIVLVTSFLHLPFLVFFRVIFILVSVLSVTNFIWKKEYVGFSSVLHKHWQVILLSLFGTWVYFFIWKRYTLYPLQLNWDVYEHITLANIIAQGNFSLFASQLSDTFTFDGYIPFFHILLAMPKMVLNANLVGVYWWIEYWHYLLTIIASYLLTKRFLHTSFAGFLGGIVGALIFESSIVYASLFFIPQTLVGLLFAFSLSEELTWLETILVSTLFVSLHLVIGIVAAGALFLWKLLHKNRHVSIKRLQLLVYAALFILLFSLAAHFIGNWIVTGREEAIHFTYSLSQKVQFLLQWYSFFIVFALIGIGIFTRKATKEQKVLVILAALLFSISFAPISYFLKFYVLGRYVIDVVLVAGIVIPLRQLQMKWQKIIASFLMLILLVVFYINQNTYKSSLYFEGYASQISYEEIAAGNWLKAHMPYAFLISDPSTQYVLEAVSGDNTQGGAYMNLQTRRTLSRIAYDYNAKEVRSQLLSIHDALPSVDASREQTLLVLSGRYFAWQRLPQSEKDSFYYNIWSAQMLSSSDKLYIEQFLQQNPYYKVVYSNSEMVILQVL